MSPSASNLQHFSSGSDHKGQAPPPLADARLQVAGANEVKRSVVASCWKDKVSALAPPVAMIALSTTEWRV